MRQNKNFTWLQTCFLGSMRVIWCNSLGDSHFQIYVMNNVKIVIDYCLLITSHVYHVVSSCIHFTSYSLLSFVHENCVWTSVAIQDYVFYGVWCKICLRVSKNWVLMIKNLVFEVLGWKLLFLKNI